MGWILFAINQIDHINNIVNQFKYKEDVLLQQR